MKVFLGVDVTHNKANEDLAGKEFLIATPTAMWTDALDRQLDACLERLFKDPPLWQSILMWVSGMLAVMTNCLIIAESSGENAMSLGMLWTRMPWLFVLAAVVSVTFLVLIVLRVRWYRDVLADEPKQRSEAAIERIYQEIYAELGVPADAVTVDVLQFSYTRSRGEIGIVKDEEFAVEATNYEFKLFFDSAAVYLVDRDGKYAFPRAALCRIRTVDQCISMLSWNKERSHKRAPWSAYDLRRADDGTMYVKPYHILELEKDGKTWGVWFPAYELPIFEKASGLVAEK